MWKRFKRIFVKSEYFSRRFFILDFLSGGRLYKIIHSMDLKLGHVAKMYALQKHPELDFKRTESGPKRLNRSVEELNDEEGKRLHEMRELITAAYLL